MTKVNNLHLHMTDDDSIPIAFPSYPDMVNYTAFSAEEIYTPQDLKGIIKYANDRGIKVIPEVDIPGHIRALGNYPKLNHLLTCYNKNYMKPMPDNQTIIGGPPSAVLNPTLNETYDFIAAIAKDVHDIFGEADFYHFGGDEVNTASCWLEDPRISEFMKEQGMETGRDLFVYFNNRVTEVINQVISKDSNITKPLAHWSYYKNLDLEWGKGSIIQYWGHTDTLTEFRDAYKGHKQIISPQNLFYFDCGTGNKYGASLCDPYETWAVIKAFEPTDYYGNNSDLLGGEGTLWSELATPYNIFNKIWPRLGVISSIFWSQKVEGLIQWDDVVADLVAFRNYWNENGIEGNKISSRHWETHPYDTFAIYKEELVSKNIINEAGNFVKGQLSDNREEIINTFNNIFM